MCSFGKDSTAMLHLIRSIQDVPVIHFKDHGQNKKYEFADRLCKKWKIQTKDLPPVTVDLIAKNGRVDLLQIIPMGNILAFKQTELHKPQTGKCVCSLQLLRETPCKLQPTKYDLIFNGHRGDDVDSFWGKVPLVDSQFTHNNTTMFYPIKDWTRQDVWNYTEKYNIPYNNKRYCKARNYKEFNTKIYNENYHFACTECINPNNPQKVFCPIMNCEVSNISHTMQYEEKIAICKKIITNVKLGV